MRRRRVSFSSDPRWTALKRAGLAVLVALILLLGMLWFGDSSQPPSPRSSSEPISIAAPVQPSAPAPENDAPALPASDAVAQTDVATDMAAQTDAAVQTSNEPAVPPASVAGGNEQIPGEIPAMNNRASETSANAATLPEPPKVADALTKLPKAVNAPAKPPKVAETPAPPASLLDGYFVQLGVFDDTDKIGKLFENASALGLPVQIQSRVMVGPFRNKREAEAARDRLKGIAEGTVLPPQKTVKVSEKPKAKSKLRRRAK